MNSCELVTLVSTLACTLSNTFPKEDLAVLATLFTQLGDTLATILTYEERNDS